jgi:C-1 hydroxylase
MTREEIGAFFDSMQAKWASRDWDGLAAGHTLDCVVESPMFGRLQGRVAIRDSYEALFMTFPDWDLKLQDLLVDGNRVSLSFTVTATHVGDFMGIPGTNRRFQIHGVRLFELSADGLICKERRMYDFTGLLVQVGVLRAKPAKL